MANDPEKNAATPDASEPDAFENAGGTNPAGTNPAGVAGTPTPETPAGPLSPNTTTPGVGDAGTRPVTTTPSFGDPTVDRLSLDPADSDDWVTRTRLWVEENPALAIVGAVGLGLLIGRIVTMALPEPEPKTLTGKIEKRAHELAKQGRYVADDAGDAIARQLAVAADALSEASGAVAKNAKKGYSEARDFSETVAEAIGHAFSKKAGDWLEKIS